MPNTWAPKGRTRRRNTLESRRKHERSHHAAWTPDGCPPCIADQIRQATIACLDVPWIEFLATKLAQAGTHGLCVDARDALRDALTSPDCAAAIVEACGRFGAVGVGFKIALDQIPPIDVANGLLRAVERVENVTTVIDLAEYILATGGVSCAAPVASVATTAILRQTRSPDLLRALVIWDACGVEGVDAWVATRIIKAAIRTLSTEEWSPISFPRPSTLRALSKVMEFTATHPTAPSPQDRSSIVTMGRKVIEIAAAVTRGDVCVALSRDTSDALAKAFAVSVDFGIEAGLEHDSPIAAKLIEVYRNGRGM